MSTISVKAPLRLDKTFGYAMNTSYREVVKQNFKMLILTSPGERIMIPNFGVGIKHFLFEFPNKQTKDTIAFKIKEQVKLFMSFLKIEDIEFQDGENILFVKIKYFIEPLSISDDLEILVEI
jgi:phage baseplate assembly protein W